MTHRRTYNSLLRGFFAAALLCGSASCGDAQARADSDDSRADSQPATSSDDAKFYREMARQSWKYLDAYYQPSTGFVNATPTWFNTTLWDLGGQLLAFQAAKELGLLSKADYERRTRKALNTLDRVDLFQNAVFNRVYSTKDGALDKAAGAGWSATDLGRFLLALKILAIREPQFAEQAERIARRSDFSQIAKDGYLHGRVIDKDGKPADFQEGRIGYEQYVAAGFNQWGVDVRHALTLQNGQPIDVLGVPLLGDKRSYDRLLSEPFILYGIELGLTGPYKELAANVLKVQEARFKSTGQVTIASEDAIAVKPHYFYYYCVYCNQKPFVIGLSSPRQLLEEPRWVSTKGAFGWHALMPSDYTRTAIQHVTPALDSAQGWATGVYEGTRASTKTFDVNTAVVLMEIAYYQLRGRKPLIEAASLVP